jgi:diacylglycerol kinase family enzyme
MDVGGFGNRYFTYISAFGAFTEVSYSTPQESKRSLGHLAYVLEGLSSLTQITPRHTVVEHDNGVIEDNFVFGGVTNSTSVAGLVKLDAKTWDSGRPV